MRDYQSWCENGLGKGECHWKMGYGKCMDGPNPKRTGATCAPRIFPEVVDVQKDGQCVDNGASCSRRGTAKCLNGVEAQGGVSCMLSGDYGCQDIRGRCEPHVVTSSSGKSGKSGGRH